MNFDLAPPTGSGVPSDRKAGGRKNKRGLALKAWIRALDALGFMEQAPAATLCGLVDDLARRHGAAPALLGEESLLSFSELAARANQIARWAVDEQIAGKTICLLMPNCPDYVAIWLGLTRAGCVVALLNTTLAAGAITHCIRTAGAIGLLVDAALLATIETTNPQISSLRLWVYDDAGASSGLATINRQLLGYSGSPMAQAEIASPIPSEVALLIYTSGTTGLPKGAKVTHARILEWSLWFAGMMDVQREDRLYDCLPMYHSVGGVVAIGAMLVRGASVLLSRRFSASRFWDDVVGGGCTIVQYIGELCRYLTLSPPHRLERAHRLRLACGNGLQAGVWQNFQERFAIPQILEFYAATEGNVSLYNCEGQPGAIGRVPSVLAHRFPVALIRIDPESGSPVRDPRGLCTRCASEETGEAIGRIDMAVEAPARTFDGYTDPAASAQKVLHDVFIPGDRWFRTGDLMRKDSEGFYYFVDRMGDTFRWKGENVSTTEVSAVLQACPGVRDAVVFGVRLPGQEGRAGMAAVIADEGFDLAVTRLHLAAALPDYAQPLFVRICQSLDVTATHKLTRTRLAAEGFEDNGDPIWFNDRATGHFVPFDPSLRAEIDGGRRRL